MLQRQSSISGRSKASGVLDLLTVIQYVKNPTLEGQVLYMVAVSNCDPICLELILYDLGFAYFF